MKILVLQLARYGDIYLTWPSLRALRRQNPDAEIHLLVREKFKAATEGLGSGIIVHTMPISDILAPLVSGPGVSSPSVEVAKFVLDEWIDQLSAIKWDRIINLSF